MITINFQNCFIFILLCLFSFLCFFLFFRKPRSGYGLPPSPPSLPVIGHLHLILSLLPHKSLQKLSSKYGPLLHLRIFNFPIVLVSSASMAYEIYRTHDVNISSRGDAGLDDSLLFGSSGFISAPYGDYWKRMKKLIATKLLRPHAIEQSRGVRAKELERFYGNLLDKAMKKESVEFSNETMKFTNNTICRMSIGRSCSEDNGEAEKIKELIVKTFDLTKKITFENIFRGKLKKLGISLFKNEIMEVSDAFDEFLESFLVEHEEKLNEHQNRDIPDMMDLLLEAYRDEKAEYKITRKQIKSLFVEIFVGGTDTSAQTTQWTMAEILTKPNVLERLRDEIDSVVGKTRLIQETDLPNLPYLQAVVKEGLRLHPPSPVLVRTSQERCEIKGFYLPEKTTFFVNVYAVMRDPKSWEEPDEFKPERFIASSSSEQESDREEGMKYIPFGGGRRGCPGSNLAYIFVGTAIGMMVQCFDWKIEGDKISMEEIIRGMTITMTHPPKCTPIVRIDPSTLNL